MKSPRRGLARRSGGERAEHRHRVLREMVVQAAARSRRAGRGHGRGGRSRWCSRRAVPPKAIAFGNDLYFHGGGFVTGNVEKARRLPPRKPRLRIATPSASSIASRPSIRSRPPLMTPVGAYRCATRRGADPANTVFFGGSAAACLALSALLQIRELRLPYPAGAVCSGRTRTSRSAGRRLSRTATSTCCRSMISRTSGVRPTSVTPIRSIRWSLPRPRT